MNKSFNEIERDILEKNIISDEDIDAFREIDGMLSVTTMAWAVKVCHNAAVMLKKGKSLSYNNKDLSFNEFENLLRDNLSDYMVRRILSDI